MRPFEGVENKISILMGRCKLLDRTIYDIKRQVEDLQAQYEEEYKALCQELREIKVITRQESGTLVEGFPTQG